MSGRLEMYDNATNATEICLVHGLQYVSGGFHALLLQNGIQNVIR